MFKRFLFFILVFSFKGMPASSQNASDISNLKAAFIYNFTKYIEWDFSESNEFTIGIIGQSSIYDPLVEIAKTKTVSDKKIIIRRFTKPEDITFCNILFIPANSPFALSALLAKTNKGTLTISEDAGYAQQGTAFNFVVDRDKLKFEANVKSIISAGLKASSQLLKLAKIVD